MVRFARATGDIHALSAADVRLIALAHGLEVAAHGAGHLRELPHLPRALKKKVHDEKELPGWGVEGGDWAEIDRLNEEEAAAAEATLLGEAGEEGASRIATMVQQLSLGGGEGSEGEEGEEGDSEDEGEWETAAKTHNSARRQKRKVGGSDGWWWWWWWNVGGVFWFRLLARFGGCCACPASSLLMVGSRHGHG